MSDFKVGDRVEFIGHKNLAGFEGVVRHDDFREAFRYVVEFERNSRFLHDCNGYIPSGLGYWCRSKDLRLATPDAPKVGQMIKYAEFPPREVASVKGGFVRFVNGQSTDLGWIEQHGGFTVVNTAPTTPHIVASIRNGKPAPNPRPHVHASQGDAETEAERLANLHPNQTFAVFAQVATRMAKTTMERT